jgi:hypothetical protein
VEPPGTHVLHHGADLAIAIHSPGVDLTEHWPCCRCGRTCPPGHPWSARASIGLDELVTEALIVLDPTSGDPFQNPATIGKRPAPQACSGGRHRRDQLPQLIRDRISTNRRPIIAYRFPPRTRWLVWVNRADQALGLDHHQLLKENDVGATTCVDLVVGISK